MNDAVFAFLEAFDDDTLSEGAHMAMLMDGVQEWNRATGQDLDPHDTWLEYIKRKYRDSIEQG